jgi:hypothetical protein
LSSSSHSSGLVTWVCEHSSPPGSSELSHHVEESDIAIVPQRSGDRAQFDRAIAAEHQHPTIAH